MGAVLAFFVVLVGHIVILIHVAVGIGDLGADISFLAGNLNVQLILDGIDLLCVQKIQRSNILVIGHSLLFRRAGKSVLKRFAGEGLVLYINTGVNHSKSAAGAGQACGPGDVGADHVAGGAVVGPLSLFLVLLNLIARLQDDGPDAGNLLDGLNLAIEDICGNAVCCQSEVPLDIQLAADRFFDPGSHGVLRNAEAGAVDLRQGIVRNSIKAETGVDGRRTIQKDGNTNRFSQCVVFHGNRVSLTGSTQLDRLRCTGFNRFQSQLFDLVPCGLCRLSTGHRGQQ